jgi:glyoxylase-like metal-dependent hydrolase (beta-lactamase superfamily II)
VWAFHVSDGVQPLRDTQLVSVGDVHLRVLHTPGHTWDHVTFLAEGTGAMFTGDAVLGRGTAIVDPGEGDLGQYLQSLRRMREARPRVLYPGHGPTVFDAVGKITEYEAHRGCGRNRCSMRWAAASTGSGNWSRRSTRTFRWSSIRRRGCSSWRSWPSSNGSAA